MKMQGFLLIISIIIFTTTLTYCTMNAETIKKKTSTFTVKSGETIMSSCNTTDVYSESKSKCGAMCILHDACCVASFSKESSICRLDITERCCVATNPAIGCSVMTRNQYKSKAKCGAMCVLHDACCVASFSKESSICRLDITERCCVATNPAIGCSVMTRNQYIPATCAGCISFGNSMYSIIEDFTEWEKAKENCKCLGGKLVEMETSEENEFIKNAVRTRNTGVQRYWIGGYNFNNDDDMEWISKPYQVMAFSDMNHGEPNHPLTDLCMMVWRSYDFRWGDHPAFIYMRISVPLKLTILNIYL